MRFSDIFKEVRVPGQSICPECHGAGWIGGVTLYTESGTNSAFICDSCNGTGMIHSTYIPNTDLIKEQMFMARYFHHMDPTQWEV